MCGAKMGEVSQSILLWRNFRDQLPWPTLEGHLQKRAPYLAWLQEECAKQGNGGAVISTYIGNTVTRRHRAKDQVTFASCQCE